MADNIKMGKVVDGELFANNGNLVIQCTATQSDKHWTDIVQTSETPITPEQVCESVGNGQNVIVILTYSVPEGDVREIYTVYQTVQGEDQGQPVAYALFCNDNSGTDDKDLMIYPDGSIHPYH